MQRMQLMLGRLMTVNLSDLKREDGQGVTEYAIALGFVAVVMAGLLTTTLGTPIKDFVGRVATAIGNLNP
jgi:Flp pilus assembly pilin Flp